MTSEAASILSYLRTQNTWVGETSIKASTGLTTSQFADASSELLGIGGIFNETNNGVIYYSANYRFDFDDNDASVDQSDAIDRIARAIVVLNGG